MTTAIQTDEADVAKIVSFRDTVRVKLPFDKGHPSDQHSAWNYYLTEIIRGRFTATMSADHVERYCQHVPHEYRTMLGELPVGFYNRRTGEWISALHASPADWDAGEDQRIELAEQVLHAAAAFKDKARLLRKEGVDNLLELLNRKKAA